MKLIVQLEVAQAVEAAGFVRAELGRAIRDRHKFGKPYGRARVRQACALLRALRRAISRQEVQP